MPYTNKDIDQALVMILPNTKSAFDRNIEMHRPSLLKEAAVRLLIENFRSSPELEHAVEVVKEALQDLYFNSGINPTDQ